VPVPFEDGDVIVFKAVVCIDLNCFTAIKEPFVFESDCVKRFESFFPVSTDANIGLFLRVKKHYEREWVSLKDDFFGGKSIPTFSRQPKRAVIPLLGVPAPDNSLFFYTGIVLVVSSLALMRFSRKKIIFVFFLVGVALLVGSLALG
jgi:hypothetical protein